MSESGQLAQVDRNTVAQHEAAMQIKVMADYECAPLWWDQPSRVGDIRPEHLGLSPQLVAELWDWAAKFDAILNRQDPAQSRFATDADEHEFNRRGRILTQRVALQLTTYKVRYWLDARPLDWA